MSLAFLKAPTAKPATFDFISAYSYANLNEADAVAAKQAAMRINKHLSNAMDGFIDIGFDLHDMKAKLPHGEFGKWIAAEFSMTARSAQNFMNAATLAGAVGTDFVTSLPRKVVYLLASPKTPTEVAVNIYERMEAGEALTVKAICKQIKAATPNAEPEETTDDAPSAEADAQPQPEKDAVALLKTYLGKSSLKFFRQHLKACKPDLFVAEFMKAVKP